MTGELKKICALLKAPDPELRCAAARVLAALEADDDDVVAALAKAGGDDNGMVRGYAMDALTKLAKPKHADLVLPLLDGPMRDKALPLVKALGGNPMQALKKGLDDPARRAASAQSIGKLGGKAAFEALLKETTDEDVEYVKEVTNLLKTVIDGLDDAEKEKAYELARKALEKAGERIARVAAVRVLGYLRVVDASEILAKLTSDKEHPSVRSHAIHALGQLNYVEKKAPASLLKTLLALLEDKDGHNIVEPAIEALRRLPLPESLDVEPLVAHPSARVRLLAVRVLGERGDKDSGRRLIEMLEDRAEEVKNEVMEALRHEPKFAAMLAQFLEKEEGKGGRADLFATILKGYREGLPKDQVEKFLEKGLDQFEKDGSQNWALECAKSASPSEFRAALFERGLKHKKAKRLSLAERFLGLFLREGGGDEEARFEVATVRLAMAPKTGDAGVRAQSYPVAMLRDIARADAKRLMARVKKDALWGGPEFLFVGQAFAETSGLEAVGAELLKKAVKDGSTKEAAAAKAALKAIEEKLA